MSEAEQKVRVWIIEQDHLPYTVDGKVVSFPVGSLGTQEMKNFLNRIYCSKSQHYWDAVLYERRPAAQRIEVSNAK
jgi:hypothetical protein